jgi:hypothetical protein
MLGDVSEDIPQIALGVDVVELGELKLGERLTKRNELPWILTRLYRFKRLGATGGVGSLMSQVMPRIGWA